MKEIVDVLKPLFEPQVLATLVSIAIVVVIVWVVYKFFVEGTKNSAQKYYELKLQLCTEVANTVARIATSNDDDTIQKETTRFEELYWGQLILVEDTPLEEAMVDFRNHIMDSRHMAGSKDEDSRRRLRIAALRVSRACFNMLQPRWLDLLKASLRTPRKA